jgi:hypothetical protein
VGARDGRGWSKVDHFRKSETMCSISCFENSCTTRTAQGGAREKVSCGLLNWSLDDDSRDWLDDCLIAKPESKMAHERPPTEKEKQQNMKPQAPQESHGGNNAPDAPPPTGERGNGAQRRQSRARVRT